MKPNFESFAIGTKVQSYDKDGYYVMDFCGVVVKHLGGGHAIIHSFEGNYCSTVVAHKVVEVEVL